MVGRDQPNQKNGCQCVIATTSNNLQRRIPLAEFTNLALTKNCECEHRSNCSLSETSVTPILCKQSLTSHQLYPAMCGIYRGSVALGPPLVQHNPSFQPLCTSGIGELGAIARYTTFVKSLALSFIGTPWPSEGGFPGLCALVHKQPHSQLTYNSNQWCTSHPLTRISIHSHWWALANAH